MTHQLNTLALWAYASIGALILALSPFSVNAQTIVIANAKS